MVYFRYSANDITAICKSLKVFQSEVPNKLINEEENKTTLHEHYDKQIQVSLSAFDLCNVNILNDKVYIYYINRLGSRYISKLDTNNFFILSLSLIQELLLDKTNLEESLRKKEDEIIMLKSRLSQNTYCFSVDELQSRLRALTITLVQKQSSLESVTAEKNAILLKMNLLQVKVTNSVLILHFYNFYVSI